MNLPERLHGLAGVWSGKNILYTPWLEENPVRESASEALVSAVARKGFLKVEYEWSFEEKPQDGVLIFGFEKDSETVNAVWIDSWHQSENFMNSSGKGTDQKISFKGYYKVPDHPDWGWRTDIDAGTADEFKVTMYNVSPDGQEDLAVEMFFSRK